MRWKGKVVQFPFKIKPVFLQYLLHLVLADINRFFSSSKTLPDWQKPFPSRQRKPDRVKLSTRGAVQLRVFPSNRHGKDSPSKQQFENEKLSMKPFTVELTPVAQNIVEFWNRLNIGNDGSLLQFRLISIPTYETISNNVQTKKHSKV